MKVRVVFIDVVKLDYVRMRGEEVENLGFHEEALGVEGVTGCKALVDGLDSEGVTGGARNTSKNGSETSPADLLAS